MTLARASRISGGLTLALWAAVWFCPETCLASAWAYYGAYAAIVLCALPLVIHMIRGND